MTALFWVAGIVAVLAAIGVVASRTAVHSVIALIVNFVALAALYLSLDAEFLALIQVIIYAGAILILFLFVVALLSVRKEAKETGSDRLLGQRELGYGAAALVGIFLIAAIARSGLAPTGADALPGGFGSASAFGRELLTTHLLPFELTAFVLMVAVVGVIVLVGRRQS